MRLILVENNIRFEMNIIGKISSDPNDWASDIFLNNLSTSNDNNSDEDNTNRVQGSSESTPSENTPSDSIHNMEEDDGDKPRPNLSWLPIVNK